MPTVSFVYFDLGGVMFHYDAALIELAHQNGLALTDFNTIYHQYDYDISTGKISLQDLWNIYKTKLNLKQPDNLNFFDYWTDRFIPIEPMHTLARDLSRDLPIGILSNLYPHVLEKGIKKRFVPNLPYTSIIESYKVACAKPDRKIYKIAQKHANTPAAEILFIDDKEENIDTAKSLGWQTVHFNIVHVQKSIDTIKDKIGRKS